jgi:hypothetical protein
VENQENREPSSKMQPVENQELAQVTGGVGPNFDVSKVEGFQLPSWLLKAPARATIRLY